MTPTTIFWIGLALLSLIACGYAWLLYRRERDGALLDLPDDDAGENWFRALMFTITFFATLAIVAQIDDRAERQAKAEEAYLREAGPSAFRHPPSALIEARQAIVARELAKGFGRCPPAAPGMTDILTLVIKTSADNHPEVVTCIRYAERPWVPRRGGKAEGGRRKAEEVRG